MMYIYIYIYIYIYTHVCMNILFSCIDCCGSVFLLVCVCLYVCSNLFTYILLFIHLSIYIYLSIFFLSLRLELKSFVFRAALLRLQRAHLFYPTAECLQHDVQVLHKPQTQPFKPSTPKLWIAKPLNSWALNSRPYAVWLQHDILATHLHEMLNLT